MREIGSIKQIQIQRSSLKQGQRPYRYYDPSPLLVVERMRLAAGGVLGIGAGGEQLIDVHHVDHPDSKNRQGTNGISIGFTSHYRAMRDHFGAHLTDGCAGENILVESDRTWTADALGERLVIQCGDGQMVELDGLMVAAPCVQFSQFASGQGERLPAEALKAALQFLDNGIRGFYARLADGVGEPIVRAGARVFMVDSH